MKNLFQFLFKSKVGDWETGLRAIDLFVPLPLGGDILVTGPEGSGWIVLGHELAYRFITHPNQRYRVVYFIDEGLADLKTRTDELDELLPMLTSRPVVSAVTERDLQEQVDERHTVVFVASENERFLQTYHDSVRHLRRNSALVGGITSFSLSESVKSRSFDASVVCSKSIAKQGLFPAIDLSASASSRLNSSQVTERHREIVQLATTAIAEVTDAMHEGALRDMAWHFNQSTDLRPALQALCFLSQPYFTAEVYTGKKATRIPLHESIENFESILSGKFKEVSTSEFWYSNELPR